jgi:hypothetical protein
MRTRIPSLVPDEQNVTVYIVLNDFGQLGRSYLETDEAKADEKTVVSNIISGQYSNPIRGWLLTPSRDGLVMSQRTLRTPCLNEKRATLRSATLPRRVPKQVRLNSLLQLRDYPADMVRLSCTNAGAP